MTQPSPIIIIEDDDDDKEIIESVFVLINTVHPRVYFEKCTEALDYLLNAAVQPFLILSDVNLPGMTGPELKRIINDSEVLRKKAIPFLFLSTSAEKYAVEKAYQMMVQGYFIKPFKPAELSRLMAVVIDYWELCIHPNTPAT